MRSYMVLLLVLLCRAATSFQSAFSTNCPDDSWSYLRNSTLYLPLGRQHSEYLYMEHTKKLIVVMNDTSSVSITITPCSSNILWFVQYHPSQTQYDNHIPGSTLYKNITNHIASYNNKTCQKGVYSITLKTLDKEGYVHINASIKPNGPVFLDIDHHRTNIKLIKRLREKQLVVKWERSKMPHDMHYCLVVNSRSSYPQNCRENWAPPSDGSVRTSTSAMTYTNRRLHARNEIDLHKASILNQNGFYGHGDIHKNKFVKCVGPKTHCTLEGLILGEVYYLDLFAMTTPQCNVSFAYGNAEYRYSRTKPISLKDGKKQIVNLEEQGGVAIFRFKIGRKISLSNGFTIQIIPCGGAVAGQIIRRKQIIANFTRVDSFYNFTVNNSKLGDRYVIKIHAVNELRRLPKVEVRAFTRSRNPFPLPELPADREVRELTEMRRCDSVTIEWRLSPDNTRPYLYCIFITESKQRECHFDGKLPKNKKFSMRICDQYENSDKIITKTLNHLEHGTSFTIQVTAQIGNKGISIAYNLLRIQTNSSCTSRNKTSNLILY